MTLEDAATLMEWGKSSLHRIEKGQNQKIRIRDLEGLIEIYGIEEPRAAELRGLASELAGRQSWCEYGGVVPERFFVYLGLGSAARRQSTYEPDLVPGLLQTREYGRTLVAEALPNESPDDVDRRMGPRLRRRQLLTRKTRPVQFDAILSETVLHRVIGGPSVMAGQLKHVADMSTRPNITVRVVPFSAGMPGGDQLGSFVILDFDTDGRGIPIEPTTVYLEGHTNDSYSEKEHIVDRYRLAFDRLRRASLDEVATRNLLRKKAKEYERDQ